MSIPQEHKEYRTSIFTPEVSIENFTEDEVSCLQKYGAWLKALMLRKIIPYTDEQREFVKMCNGEAHPPNEIARTWKKYQINLMYEIAIKMDSTLGSADTKYTYSHVVTSFHNIAAQGHTKAMEWLQMEGIAFTPPNEPPLLNIARIYPKKYTGGDMMGLVISGSFGSGTRR